MFIKMVRRYMHVVMCMSPLGEEYASRSRLTHDLGEFYLYDGGSASFTYGGGRSSAADYFPKPSLNLP